jgi:hypothetical protein
MYFYKHYKVQETTSGVNFIERDTHLNVLKCQLMRVSVYVKSAHSRLSLYKRRRLSEIDSPTAELQRLHRFELFCWC